MWFYWNPKNNIAKHIFKVVLLLFAWLYTLEANAQLNKNKPYINRKDTVFTTLHNDSVMQWVVNRKTHIWRVKDTSEVWRPSNAFSYWEINEGSRIWTLPKAYRLWMADEGVAVWRYSEAKRDWMRCGFARHEHWADSLEIWRVNDSLLLSKTGSHIRVWNTDRQTTFWSTSNRIEQIWSMNDTTSFWKVDSLQYIQLYQDSCEIWELDRSPDAIKLSSQTTIWPLLPNTEVWKAGSKINVWSQNKKDDRWNVNDTLPYFEKLMGERMWLINKQLKVIVLKDSVQIWRRVPKKVWQLSPQLHVWHYTPPPPVLPPDTIDTLPPPEMVERIKLLKLAKHRKLWVVDEDTHIWQLEEHNELWEKRKGLEVWSVNDSTRVWTLDDSYRVTQINGKLKFWVKPTGNINWEEMRKPKAHQTYDSLQIWYVNDDLTISASEHRVEAWKVNRDIVINKKKPTGNWLRNDTTQCWNLNDTTHLWQNGKNDPGIIWERKDYSRLHINDSLFFWKVDQQMRVSRIGDSLAIWRFEKKWAVVDTIASFELNDSLRVWEVNPNFQIWQHINSTQFWRPKPKSRVYRLRDSIRAWTFTRPPMAERPKAIKHWTFNGRTKVNSYQNQLRNWAGGGEGSISLQSEAKLESHYKNDKLKWDSWIEFKYGINKPGEKDIQKRDDKLELDSRLNYDKNSLWSYSLYLNTKSQVDKGINYSNDTRISDFLSPLYFNLGVGVDYRLYKTFQLYLSPLTAKVTYVRDTAGINQQSYGVHADKKMLNQTGAYINGRANIPITENIRVESRFTLFSNYFEKPENIDVDWIMELFLKVNRFISAEVAFQLIYDDDIKIPVYETINGTRTKVTDGARLQLREVFKIGFVYEFK